MLQDELGAFNDAAVAPRVAAALAGPTAAATVAIESWSAGRAGASGRGIAAAWSAFEAVAPFWKREIGPNGARWIEPTAEDRRRREEHSQ